MSASHRLPEPSLDRAKASTDRAAGGARAGAATTAARTVKREREQADQGHGEEPYTRRRSTPPAMAGARVRAQAGPEVGGQRCQCAGPPRPGVQLHALRHLHGTTCAEGVQARWQCRRGPVGSRPVGRIGLAAATVASSRTTRANSNQMLGLSGADRPRVQLCRVDCDEQARAGSRISARLARVTSTKNIPQEFS